MLRQVAEGVHPHWDYLLWHLLGLITGLPAELRRFPGMALKCGLSSSRHMPRPD